MASNLVRWALVSVLRNWLSFQVVLATRQDSALMVVCYYLVGSIANYQFFTLVSYETFKNASEADLAPMRISEGTIGKLFYSIFLQKLQFKLAVAFMFESSMMFTITDYAMNRSGKLHGWLIYFSDWWLWSTERTAFSLSPVHEPKMWDDLKGQFMNHIPEINADLKAAGLPLLGSELEK